MFIDESSANQRTSKRHNIWAPNECSIIVKELLKHTPRWLILPAYIVDGYISTVLFQGSINTKRFEDFVIDFVLPRCIPFPSRNLVLVMNNCSIHQSKVIATACAHASVLI